MKAAIRLLAAGDSLALLTDLLHRAYAPLGARSLNYTAVDQTVETTAHRVSLGTCAVLTLGERIVGTITVRPPKADSDCAWYRLPHVAIATQFAVEPEHQGAGLGAQLMDWAEAWARSNGYAEIAVDTAEPAAHLVAYYARRGHRLVDDVQWPGKTYRSVILSKRLSGR
jgi:GNAT superfamily N-acetyltransferase